MGNDQVEQKLRSVKGYLSRRQTGVYILTEREPIRHEVSGSGVIDLYPNLGDGFAWTAPICTPVIQTLLGKNMHRMESSSVILAMLELRENNDPDKILDKLNDSHFIEHLLA